MALPKLVSGYIPLPVLVSGMESKKSSRVYHIIYVRRHIQQSKSQHGQSSDSESDSDSEPTNNIVFAANLPLDTTLEGIKALAQDLSGTIVDEIRVDRANSRGHIVFIDEAACTRFLQKAQTKKLDSSSPLVWDPKLPNGTEGKC